MINVDSLLVPSSSEIQEGIVCCLCLSITGPTLVVLHSVSAICFLTSSFCRKTGLRFQLGKFPSLLHAWMSLRCKGFAELLIVVFCPSQFP